MLGKLLFALALLLVAVSADTLAITSVGPVRVGTYTAWVFIEASLPVNQTTTISWTESTGDVSFTVSSCTLGATVQSCSFRVLSKVDGTYTVSFTVSNDNGQYPGGIADQHYTFTKRPITFDFAQSTSTVGFPSEPMKIYTDTAPDNDLTINIAPDDHDITFFPNPITIKANTLSTSVYWICNTYKATTSLVTYTITGAESDWYVDGLTGTYQFQVGMRHIAVARPSNLIALGYGWQGSLVVYTPDLTNSSVTVVPQAADTTFSPSSVSFDRNTQVQPLSFTTTSPGTKVIHFFVSGEGYYAPLDPTGDITITVPLETIEVNIPSTLIQSATSGNDVMSIVLPRPPINGLTIQWFASNIQFNQSSWTVGSGTATTSIVIAMTPVALGKDTISFLISGPDAAWYNPIPDITNLVVGKGTFLGPSQWYIPPLYVGVESDKLPIRVSVPPASSVTLTPTSADLQFNPSSLTFSSGSEQQWFTITPKYSTADNSDTYTSTVYWAISGADYTWFTAPSSFNVRVNKRTVQVAWSAHLYDDLPTIGLVRHLHKQYKVWVTANYIGSNDAFSVTPTSPYFSFSPSTLYFNSKNTRIEVSATVIGVVSGSVNIDYLLGGQDGAFYSVIDSDTFTTAIRPLYIAQANLAPDTRVPGELIYNPNQYPQAGYTAFPQLGSYHVYDFLFRSPVLPDSKLTITPHCNHATFSPKSISFKPSDAVTQIDRGYTIQDNGEVEISYPFDMPGLFLEANFSVTPLAAGTFEVWFELSDSDAPYYDVPDHMAMTFKPINRADYEPTQKNYSAAASFGPSMIVLALTVIAAMFM